MFGSSEVWEEILGLYPEDNIFYKKKTIAPHLLTPCSEVNVSRKLLCLSLNVDKEEGVHATLLIVFVPSKDFAFGLEFLDIVKTTFV